jgi:putative membrane protein
MLHTLKHMLPAAWLGMLVLAACGPRDRADTGDAAAGADTGVTTGAVPADTVAEADVEFSDANIVALLDEANMADSAAGALAAGKATNNEVKQFARLMMSEHHALRKQGQQLATQLKVTPEPPATDPLKPLAESGKTALESAPKGPEFDRVYIEQEITAHKAVLDLVGKGKDQADNAQLKALIEQAEPVIQKHLDQAEALKDKLGEATS